MVRTVHSGDAEICVETFGEEGDPAVLLMGGSSASMDYWEDEFCRRLAAEGRQVTRYDYRDTGCSTSYPPGLPTYTSADLIADAVAILDALDIPRAHVAGISMGGGLAQQLVADHRDRVSSLTLASTTFAGEGGEDLPGPSPEIRQSFADQPPLPDWEDRDAVVDYMVEGDRLFTGSAEFDEERSRALAGRVYDRTVSIESSLTNHWLLGSEDTPQIDLGALEGLPALVLHGSLDPLFPPAHGQALAAAIPGARFVELEGVGHQYPPPRTWDVVIAELTALTA